MSTKVGDHFEAIAKSFGYVKTSTCNCHDIQDRMNKLNPHKDTPQLGVLTQELFLSGWSMKLYLPKVVYSLALRVAIARARKDLPIA
jgi:hypothetical protein